MELIKDYDREIKYHPRKANVVADALSRKGQGAPSKLYSMVVQASSRLLEHIKEAQIEAMKAANVDKEGIGKKKRLRMDENSRGFKTWKGRIWVPLLGGIQDLLLRKLIGLVIQFTLVLRRCMLS